MIDDWEPEPLVPADTPDKPLPQTIVESGAGPIVTIRTPSGPKDLLNMGSCNFLGLAGSAEVKAACTRVIQQYGVGSCGPRGFYGSIDVHLLLEQTFSRFMGGEDSILYSDGIACLSSVIPAFAKQGDVLVMDAAVNAGIQNGAKLSRSTVHSFKHNDTKDLAALLQRLADADGGKTKLPRRFIVVEGISQHTGRVCPLREVAALAAKYKYRVILDDSMALGVLGESGRGSLDHWQLTFADVPIVCATLDASLASVGGLCVSTRQVVGHQRLSGLGYCFSAASPPYTAEAATVGLGLLHANPALPSLLRTKARAFRKHLRDALARAAPAAVNAPEDAESPIVHLTLVRAAPAPVGKDASDRSKAAAAAAVSAAERRTLECVKEALRDDFGVAASVPGFLPTEHHGLQPSLRLNVTVDHADADLKTAADAVAKALAGVLAEEAKGNPNGGACALDAIQPAPKSSKKGVASSSSAASAAAVVNTADDDDDSEAEVPRRRSTRSRSRK